MPELPDVETYRRYLDATALHQVIRAVSVEQDILGSVSDRTLRRALDQHELEETRRHGKWLFARTDGGRWLALHFGMTGSLSYGRDPADEDGHTRLRLTFDDDYGLVYECTRKLGTVDLADDPDEFVEEHDLGPDALAVDADTFADLLGSRGGIKSALMRQEHLAGIGNIYADEILFQAHLHPQTAVADLDDVQRRHLRRVMRRVLRTATERQADPQRLPRSWLLPRRREDAPCPRCDGRVRRISVSGRSTYLCPHCQPRPR